VHHINRDICTENTRSCNYGKEKGEGRRGAGQRLERQQEPSEEEEEQVRKQYIDSKI
jgi:hypothetical protein